MDRYTSPAFKLPESHVVDLNEKNFDDLVNESPYMLVAFTADEFVPERRPSIFFSVVMLYSL